MPRKKPERNTHKLPTGEAIRREVVRTHRAIHKRIIAAIQQGTKADTPNEYEFDDMFRLGALAMSERMTPILEAIWDKAGSQFNSRIGLDPDAWSVVNPHTAQMIADAALDLCTETLATTAKDTNEAIADTRAALQAGVVERGQSVQQLTKAIKAVFEDAETWRARRIAKTEASRAVHAAQEQAAIESGVVVGWKWMLSGDACPVCVQISEQVGAVRIGQEFARLGSNPNYSNIRHPPAHPGCMCALEEVLDIDRKPTWGATVDQPTGEGYEATDDD